MSLFTLVMLCIYFSIGMIASFFSGIVKGIRMSTDLIEEMIPDVEKAEKKGNLHLFFLILFWVFFIFSLFMSYSQNVNAREAYEDEIQSLRQKIDTLEKQK